MTHLAHQVRLLKKTPFPHLKNQTSPKHKIGNNHLVVIYQEKDEFTSRMQFSLSVFETDVLLLDFKSLLPWKPSDAGAAPLPVQQKPSVLSPSHGKQRRRWDGGTVLL